MEVEEVRPASGHTEGGPGIRGVGTLNLGWFPVEVESLTSRPSPDVRQTRPRTPGLPRFLLSHSV